MIAAQSIPPLCCPRRWINPGDSVMLDSGTTTHFEPEAILNRLMCAAAAQGIVVTDSSKFGRVCLHRILDPSRIHTLVTDDHTSPALATELSAFGVSIIRAATDDR